MTYRTARSLTISNDEISLSTTSRLHRLFHRVHGHHSHLPTTTFTPLYLACQTNDFERVKSHLINVKIETINRQYPPKNETVLHVAARNQNKEIIEGLLSKGAQRELKNSDGQQAYDLAEIEEIKGLLKPRHSSRFVFQLNYDLGTTGFSQRKTKCKSCCLVNDVNYYEWELVDQNALRKALEFRHELKPSAKMNEKYLKHSLTLINKSYLKTRLEMIDEQDRQKICELFKSALDQHDPCFIIRAYTLTQNFSKLLNTDMARNVIHDLKNGCSKFSCECLYSTEDGIKAITSILFHHPIFEKRTFQGKVNRGIVMSKHKLDHLKVGSSIITTTFLSSSTNADVAKIYSDINGKELSSHSFFCTYEIINNGRTALDISDLSPFHDENEILILPYTAFLITRIVEEQDKTHIYLKEQCLTDITSITESGEYSLGSTVHPIKHPGSNIIHNMSDISSPDSDNTRSRSKTMSELDIQYF